MSNLLSRGAGAGYPSESKTAYAFREQKMRMRQLIFRKLCATDRLFNYGRSLLCADTARRHGASCARRSCRALSPQHRVVLSRSHHDSCLARWEDGQPTLARRPQAYRAHHQQTPNFCLCPALPCFLRLLPIPLTPFRIQFDSVSRFLFPPSYPLSGIPPPLR